MKLKHAGFVAFILLIWLTFISLVYTNVKYLGVIIGSIAIIGELFIGFIIAAVLIIVMSGVIEFIKNKTGG